jgi:hypothetical protein
MRTFVAVFTALVMALVASASFAQVQQPNGTRIPQGPNAQNFFNARMEPINALNDATIATERFVPGCTLRFELVLRDPGSEFQNAFGWYNVTGSRPANSDLHVLIPCDARNGFVATLDLRTNPAYRGGEIGFFLRTPQPAPGVGCTPNCCGRIGSPGFTYFTERRYSDDFMSSGAVIHLLVYDSRRIERAFYFMWEDLYGGGDNQFTDFVALVSNISCSGAGRPCTVAGAQGACAQGTEQCRAGRLTCVSRNVMPSPERCDAIDNDCNGMVDDGMGLCPAGLVCDRGVCVPQCVEGACRADQSCTRAGLCVETACTMVNCPAGQRCERGMCVDDCSGVRCPAGQSCRAGRCLDACAGLTCDADQVCIDGLCQLRCPCKRCGASETCAMDGRCVETACVGRMCPSGQVCRGGACVDACVGVSCPRGESCHLGECRPMPDGGVAPMDAAVADAAAMDASMRTDARTDSGRRADGGGVIIEEPGCGCHTLGHRRPFGSTAALALSMASLVMLRGRRRRATR